VKRKREDSTRTLREFIRAKGGLAYCADLEALTREGLGEFHVVAHRNRGRWINIRLPSRTKPIVHARGLARGMRRDDATELAWEAGFFFERPAIRDLIDALDRDVAHPDAPVEAPTDEELEQQAARADLSWAALQSFNRKGKRALARRNRRLAA